ncbi:MAG TPA: XrtB/PEP-CTERM-associated transcriptional regulator EpsA [Usitatibacter sp.]|nr:XrtB/PEP-CTERM-associated transcriptional regulator EpsA [Usitatibacter sp.]
MRLVHRQPEPRPPRGPLPEGALDGDTQLPDIAANEGAPARLNDSERESLLLNIDVSLRVHTRPQLFSWVQGALQSMIPHEVLICGLQESRQGAMRVDSFTTAPVDCAKLNELFQQDTSLVPHLIKLWEENRCQAITCETERGPFASGALARELLRLGVSTVLAHGTHDASGNMTSFFVFAGRPGALGGKQTYLADLAVPYLHAAWVRSQVTWPLDRAGANKPAKTGLLTPREQQILQWIYHGKSNIEIGMILEISPLTVKNHVQKTLRKLNVLNRTQAVGKALALRIVNP